MLSRILHEALGRTGVRGISGPAVKLYSRVVVRLTAGSTSSYPGSYPGSLGVMALSSMLGVEPALLE